MAPIEEGYIRFTQSVDEGPPSKVAVPNPIEEISTTQKPNVQNLSRGIGMGCLSEASLRSITMA